MAIRIFSIEEAMKLKDKIPRLMLIRAKQFLECSGVNPDEGHLVLYENGDEIERISELAPHGLLDEEGLPVYEFIEAFVDEKDHITWEVVVQVSNSKTIAIFIRDQDCLDPDLRKILKQASTPPQSLLELKGGKSS